MLQELKTQIVSRLTRDKEILKASFAERDSKVPTRYFLVDNLLDDELANKVFEAFPKGKEYWREMSSFRENKWTSKNLENFPQILHDMTFAIQSPEVIKVIEEITGIKNQFADPSLYAGGLSIMGKGAYLHPHIDNSHNQERDLYRTVNLLFYTTPGWKSQNGGHLELWDNKVNEKITIESKFNRLVIMETNKSSWHSVCPVTAEGWRCCVSNYYFSPDSPHQEDYFHVTEFNPRPENKFTKPLYKADAFFRGTIRKLVKHGVGKKDTYKNQQSNQ
ncbi:MAG: 2OG-Fe(II) oxygenase [Halobacteriovoraceae bacterium]|nr:2OG-Fe(II) oxygenase [Halobacteriovoraceae bacterium]